MKGQGVDYNCATLLIYCRIVSTNSYNYLTYHLTFDALKYNIINKKKHYSLSAKNFEALLRTIAQIKNIGKLQKNILATQKMHYNLIITRPHILLAIQTQSVAVLHSCM